MNSSNSDSNAAIDLSFLETLRALDRPGGPDIVRTVAKIFLSNSPATLVAIEQALEAKEYALAARAAHKLKSGASNIGAHHLMKHLDEFESLGEATGSHEDRQLLLVAIQRDLAAAREALNKIVAE